MVKKKSFSACLTLLLFSCADSGPTNINELSVSEEINGEFTFSRTYYKSANSRSLNNTFSGEVVEYHDNGSLKSKYEVKRGKIIDKNLQEFYPNGNISYIQNIEDGRYVGLGERYYENGNLKRRFNFLPDNRGVENIEFYSEDGNLLRFISLLKGTYITGKDESYYENGGVELVQHYHSGFLIKEEKYNFEQKKIHQLDYLDNNKGNDGQFQRFYEDGSKEFINLPEIWDSSIGDWRSFLELQEKINSGGTIKRTTYDSEGNKVRVEHFELNDYLINTLLSDLTGSESDGFILLFENNELNDVLCIFNGKETQDWFGKCQDKDYITLSCESYPDSVYDRIGKWTHYQNLYLQIYLGSSNVVNATYVYKGDPKNVFSEKGGIYKSKYEPYYDREMPRESVLKLQWGETSNQFFLDREDPSKSYYWGLDKVPSPCKLIPAELMYAGIKKIKKIAEDTTSKNKF